jgi:biotin transport system substrate-specific component
VEKPQFLVSTNPKRRRRTRDRPPTPEKRRQRQISGPPHELLWAIIGLLLTISGTFVEVFVTNPPWNWQDQGIQFQSLGITYQIGAVLLTGCLGGKNAGALSQIAYVAIGLTLLPVFLHGGGFEYVQKPSFGYILGFIPGAWLCGWWTFRNRLRLEALAISCFCGLLTIHLWGIIYLIGLAYVQNKNTENNMFSVFFNWVNTYSLSPFPGQLLLVCAVALLAFLLRKVLFY